LGGDHREASARLYRFGERHGIIDGRAIFSVDAAGGVVDGSARLWAQTERLRAMLTFAGDMPAGEGEAAAIESVTLLRHYLDVPVAGLWRDRIDADGALIGEPAPASSFYHIVTGILPLLEPTGSVAIADRSPA
jgi:mannose-6-phosphate isomerase